ncbi:MAG: hypothetical protein IJ681_05490 [Bacteroidales bacterium]|nr:hypothetical protein [Bacteroidales bacterium]
MKKTIKKFFLLLAVAGIGFVGCDDDQEQKECLRYERNRITNETGIINDTVLVKGRVFWFISVCEDKFQKIIIEVDNIKNIGTNGYHSLLELSYSNAIAIPYFFTANSNNPHYKFEGVEQVYDWGAVGDYIEFECRKATEEDDSLFRFDFKEPIICLNEVSCPMPKYIVTKVITTKK